MALIGETGSGKSTLAAWLLSARQSLIVLRTKSELIGHAVDYEAHKIKHATGIADVRYQRFELFPRADEMAGEFTAVLDIVARQRGWCVYVDELFEIERMKLGEKVSRLMSQGRSKGVSVVSGLQRPQLGRVARWVISQSDHVVCFPLEGRDAKPVIESTTPRLKIALAQLGEHDFLWYHRAKRSLWQGSLDMRTGQLEGTRID